MADDTEQTGDDAGPAEDARIRGYLAGERAVLHEIDGWIRQEMRRRYWRLRAEHDDLFQSVHERLLHSLRTGRFEGRSSLQTYVNGIVHRTAIERLRRRYREGLFTDSHPEDLRSSDNPYRDVEVRDERRRLLQVVLSMPASCRLLWKLVFIDCLPYEQTGQALGLPVGTIKSRMWYCRRKAAAALARLARAATRRSP